MKAVRARNRCDGVMLAEALLYLTLFFMVLGLAMAALYSAWEAHGKLERAGTELMRAAEAGERWRQDVRTATGPLELTELPEGQRLRLPHGEGTVDYYLRDQTMIRAEGRSMMELMTVVSSRMSRVQSDQVDHGWLWEVELSAGQEGARVRPLFSFKAVRRGGP